MGEQVNVRFKSRFKEETASVMLAVLDPEPVITRTHLEFVSRVNGEPLLSLKLSRPNVDEFNAFISTLKQKALDEYNTFTASMLHQIRMAMLPKNLQSLATYPMQRSSNISQ